MRITEPVAEPPPQPEASGFASPPHDEVAFIRLERVVGGHPVLDLAPVCLRSRRVERSWTPLVRPSTARIGGLWTFGRRAQGRDGEGRALARGLAPPGCRMEQ